MYARIQNTHDHMHTHTHTQSVLVVFNIMLSQDDPCKTAGAR